MRAARSGLHEGIGRTFPGPTPLHALKSRLFPYATAMYRYLDPIMIVGRAAVRVVDAASAAFPFKLFVKAALWLVAVLPLILIALVGTVATAVSWLVSTVSRAIIMASAKRLGRLALPPLVRKAAFGADEGRFVEVSVLPPGVLAPEKLTLGVIAEAAAVNSRLGHDATQALLHAVIARDAFTIKTLVTDSLTNIALAHSFYYQAEEIRAKIASLIAVPSLAFDPVPYSKWFGGTRIFGSFGFNAAPRAAQQPSGKLDRPK